MWLLRQVLRSIGCEVLTSLIKKAYSIFVSGNASIRPPDTTDTSLQGEHVKARLRDGSVRFMVVVDGGGETQCDLFVMEESHRERLRQFLATLSLDIDSPNLATQANGNLDKRAIGAGMLGYNGGDHLHALWSSTDWKQVIGRDRPSDPSTAAAYLESIKASIAALFQPADLERLDGVDVDGDIPEVQL